jgi:putative membrane protein
MKKLFIALLVGCTAVMSAQTVSKKDEKFAKCAAKDGMLEVKLGQLAMANASNADVKKHAAMMVEDHTKANEELKTVAAKKNIALPTTLTEKQQKKYDKMAKLQGKDFDKHYSKCMVKDHKKAVCLFKKESKKGKDSDLKSWAAAKLPTLKQHKEMWEETCKAVKKA